MTKLKFIPLFFASLFIIGCNNDDDNTPEIVNEEEVITTVIVTLVGDTETVLLTSRDLDGDGPNPPQVTVSGNLKETKSYAGTVQFLNETETPFEDITEEVVDEADEHQVFYIPGSGLDVDVQYGNNDSQGNPLGTIFTLQTNAQGNGSFNVTLRHEPKKPNDGTLSDAGGETDVSVTFDVIVEQ